MELKALLRYTLIFSSIATLAACSGSDSATTPISTTTTISGSIFAAPISNADVSVKDTNGNTLAGPVTTASDGSFTVTIENTDLASDLVFESTGGTFTDEADGTVETAGPMSVMTEAGSLSSTSNSVHATPGSKIIHELVTQHGMTMTAAKDAFNSAFGYTPDHSIAPTDATSPDAGAEEPELLAGLRAAAFSQLADDLGIAAADQFELFDALARDLSDDTLDGKAGSAAVHVKSTTLPEDIQNRFATALLNFHNNGLMGDVYGNDQTGLTSNQIGILPFAKVALTASYRVEYVPTSMMDAMAGKSTFKINVKDDLDNGVAGATLTVMPMMNMEMHKHSTPTGTITDLGGGDYEVNIYYVMPSIMMDISMGYWDLKFMVDAKEAHFYPPVMMAMGDTLQTRLRGQNPGDAVLGMTGVEGRTYFLFRDGLSGSGSNYTFDLFIATRDSMTDFPAVDAGVTLDTDTGTVTLASVDVEVSTDGSTFTPASNSAGTTGYFSASGLDVSGGKIYARLTVDGVLKTKDGLAPDSDTDPDTTNRNVIFTVTP